MGDLFLKRAAEDGLAVDRAYVRDNLPVDLDTCRWTRRCGRLYGDYNAREEMQKEFWRSAGGEGGNLTGRDCP